MSTFQKQIINVVLIFKKGGYLMAAKKDIVCPCGKLLGTTTNSSGGGTKTCPCCKKKVRYDVTSTTVYTSYQN